MVEILSYVTTMQLSNIKALRAELEDIIARAQKQLSELEVAEYGHLRLDGLPKTDDSSDNGVNDGVDITVFRDMCLSGADSCPYKRDTTKFFIWLLLRNDREWMSARELRTKCSLLKGKYIPMVSLSPMLHEMAKHKTIIRDGSLLSLNKSFLGFNKG